MIGRPALRALADRAGILPDYTDITGVLRPTSDATRVALLSAMGLDGSTDAAASETLASLDLAVAERLIPPVLVRRRTGRGARTVRVNRPARASGPMEYRIEIALEDGEVRAREGGRSGATSERSFSLRLPARPPPGYHRLRLHVATTGWEQTARSALIVVPDSCLRYREASGRGRRFGLWTQIYGLRSRSDWGIGDTGSLERLAQWAGALGAEFLGLNPLHAVRNRGYDISPYSPLSRLFHNPIYIDIGAVPELADCPEARNRLASADHHRALERLRSRERVDYAEVYAVKLSFLRLLHRTFLARHGGGDTARGRAYQRFRAANGHLLDDFATFAALAEATGECDPRAWAAEYRHPRGAAVARFRSENRDRVDFHRFLQFELDRQLGRAAARAEDAGLGLGLYGDLAVGSAADGADPWAFPGLFVEGAHIGAPPDDYSRTGQDWGLPPVNPNRLRDDAYGYWIALLRAAMRNFGALRIDHVMGLTRQFWVPAGESPTEGAYVRYPAEELLGILALESRRHRTLIVGEDLGTLPEDLPRLLGQWGILSSRVLYFERESDGRFRQSASYPSRALVTATTHDHPPFRGFWTGRDLEIRRAVGDIESDERLRSAQAARDRDRHALLTRLAEDGLLHDAATAPSYPELCRATYAFLSRTPCRLLGVALDDLTGETEPVNLPGVGPDRYASWSRRIRESLEDLPSDPDVQQALTGIGSDRRRGGAPG